MIKIKTFDSCFTNLHARVATQRRGRFTGMDLYFLKSSGLYLGLFCLRNFTATLAKLALFQNYF